MDLNTYFDSAYESFAKRARLTGGTTDRVFRIADNLHVRICFAGEHLLDKFTRAMQHLMEPQTHLPRPDLTIFAWDSPDGQAKPPYPAWKSQRNYNWVDLLTSDQVRVCCEVKPARLTALHLEKNECLYWINDARQFPWFEQCRPFRTPLHWWLTPRNIHLLHAAAVGDQDVGVLLIGKGGAGKSTTALTCLSNGMQYAGDDHCLIGFENGVPEVYSLYTSGKLNMAENIARLPQLEHCIVNADKLSHEKAMMFLHDHFPNQMAKKMALKAVLIPTVTGATDTRITKASWSDAARALIPSTMTELQGSEVENFYGMLQLVKSLPVYKLELGSDMPQIARSIAELIHSHSLATGNATNPATVLS